MASTVGDIFSDLVENASADDGELSIVVLRISLLIVTFVSVLTYLDAEVVAFDSPNERTPYVVTSPNASFVPIHSFHTPQTLRLRADGRFGLEDCFQYPQAFSTKHPWATCITRKPAQNDLLCSAYAGLWATPTRASFVLEKGCAFANMGRLEKPAVDVLQRLQRSLSERLQKYRELGRWIPKNVLVMDFSMKSILTRLFDCPMTFRDIVAQFADFQRVCLDLKAVIDFIGTYELRLQTSETPPCADMTIMGAFTSNLEVANKMFKCGIPVWLVRTREQLQPNIKIKRIVSYTLPPQDIITDDWHDEQTGLENPFPCLHYGFGGADRHDKTRMMGSAMFDVAVIEHPECDTDNTCAVNPVDGLLASATLPSAAPHPSDPICKHIHFY
jgi:hypothetical protein